MALAAKLEPCIRITMKCLTWHWQAAGRQAAERSLLPVATQKSTKCATRAAKRATTSPCASLRGTLQTPNEKPRNLNPNQLTLPLSFAYLHIHLPHTRGVQCGDRLGRSSVAWRNHQTDACAAMAAATKTTATATHTIESFAQRCVYVIYYKRRHFASFRVGKFVRVCVSV